MAVRFLLGLILGFLVSFLIAPIVILLSKKFKARQTILHYVESHATKQGTPTMGGIIFVIGTLLCLMFVLRNDFTLAIISAVTMFVYGVLGFLDDYIKIRFKQNEGLKPYQKIIGQLGIGLILGVFCYLSPLVGSEIVFFNLTFDIGWGIIPFVAFVLIAVTNASNLIDGLDGLCSGVSVTYLISFAMIILLGSPLSAEMDNLIMLVFVFAGALLAFLTFNIFPAKVFMGDTGSLAIGGFIAITAIFTKNPLLIPIIGFLYVLTVISDIIQVLHYKRTKRRVFLMAPLHHHFEKKGVHENRIVFVYVLITALLGILSFILQSWLVA